MNEAKSVELVERNMIITTQAVVPKPGCDVVACDELFVNLDPGSIRIKAVIGEEANDYTYIGAAFVTWRANKAKEADLNIGVIL